MTPFAAAPGLSLDWLKAYSIPQLAACCDRMEAALPGINITSKTSQVRQPGIVRELVQRQCRHEPVGREGRDIRPVGASTRPKTTSRT